MESWKKPINIENIVPEEKAPGINMRTLAYNEDATMCHFTMNQGSSIPLHDHIHTQIGFVLKGKIKFLTERGEFIVHKGDSYVFNRMEKHGAEVLDDSELLELFSPCREEYKPQDKHYLPSIKDFLD
jgi:quercetin dioxygenase-like cupin family protein